MTTATTIGSLTPGGDGMWTTLNGNLITMNGKKGLNPAAREVNDGNMFVQCRQDGENRVYDITIAKGAEVPHVSAREVFWLQTALPVARTYRSPSWAFVLPFKHRAGIPRRTLEGSPGVEVSL